MAPQHYIIIAGNIGCGKTSLAQELGLIFKECKVFTEKKGRFVERFYKDKSFAFLNQLDYTVQYVDQAAKIQKSAGIVIQDRSIFDTHEVFSRTQLIEGNISDEQFAILEQLYQTAISLVRPTLLVLLEVPVETAFKRMVMRGDDEESLVTREYLCKLNSDYETWYKKFNICAKISIDAQRFSPQDIAMTVAENQMRL